MPVIQIEAQLPTDELLKAVGPLNQSNLEQFVSQVIALRARRHAPNLTRIESELSLKINEGIPADVQTRYNDLIAKRKSETLTHAEYDELLQLTRKVEKLEARRVEHLAALARLRGTTITALMRKLEIRPPAHA